MTEQHLPFILFAGIILMAFFMISFASQKLRLPSVLAFMVFGMIVSAWIGAFEALDIAAQVGIVLLFFILGLEFPLSRMLEIFKKVWPAGLTDILLNLGGGMLLAWLCGLGLMGAFMIGAVVYATSSSITAKLLEEQKRLASPETEFILALLIFEDLIAPILVSLLAGLQQGNGLSLQLLLILLLKIFSLTIGAILIGYYGFRRLNQFIAAYFEYDFMPLLAVGIALGYAGIALTLGLSEVLGAFLAGVMLSETGKPLELERLVVPLRDITLPFFFFWFGTSVVIGAGVPWPLMLIALVLWSVAGKILVGMWGGRLFGLTPRVSFRAGFSLVSRGEFSAIIASLAIPQLRIFSGLYILITAFLGVYMFQKAPALAKWIDLRWMKGAK